MKLIRHGEYGQEKPGVLDEQGNRKDMSHLVSDWDRQYFQKNSLASIAKLVQQNSLPDVPANARWGSCVARPGKVICIGLNYSDHTAETGLPAPAEPLIFQKGANTVVGPYDNIFIPRRSVKTDWEVELGVVIGTDARYLNAIEDAKHHIAGFCISHDVSEREFQMERGGQWTKGKSCDSFNPLGPFLATADEISDPHKLSMTLRVNGTLMQNGNTQSMVFNCYHIVHYLSHFMTLEAGDLISTGTPPGVGLGMNPPQYLKAGDVIDLEIEGLGKQRQTCVNA